MALTYVVAFACAALAIGLHPGRPEVVMRRLIAFGLFMLAAGPIVLGFKLYRWYGRTSASLTVDAVTFNFPTKRAAQRFIALNPSATAERSFWDDV